MINRVLIRVKVVQMLYCYLMSQTEFKVPRRPSTDDSRDTRYAYELFLELVRMLVEMNGVPVRDAVKSPMRGIPTDKKLRAGELGTRLWKIAELREAAQPTVGADMSPFDALIPTIYKSIPTLPAYKSYAKKQTPGIEDEIALWQSVLYDLIEKNADFTKAARRNAEFTYAGFHRGIMMMVDMLQSYNDNRSLFLTACKNLKFSLGKARELYLSLMELPIAITREIAHRQAEAKDKFAPTAAELHPNTRLVDNKYVKALEKNEEFQKALEGVHLQWAADYPSLNSLITRLEESGLYRDYMDQEAEPTFQEDAMFWDNAMKNILLPSDAMIEKLEGESVFWNDDLQIIGEFVGKTMRRYAKSRKEGTDVSILPAFKDKEDEEFGPKLFEAAVKNYATYRNIIATSLTGTWDANRLALMDVVIMVTAVAEMLNFPSIPVAVTLNEYVEIAGDYSTDRSRDFVNAVLRQVSEKLRQEGMLIGK